jgi:hypothetical protein
MALVLKDRVKETTTTTGTGTVTLGGAAAGFQSFVVIGNGNTTYYAIVDAATGDWEVGIGTYTLSGTTLSRTTVLSSSNSGALVNFSAGTKDVFCTYPAEQAVTLNDAQTLTNKTLNSPTLVTPALGTPASGVVTNLTGTASININGTVGATTANTGKFTTLTAAGNTILSNVNVIGASYDSVSFSVAGEELTAHGIFFSPDGFRMYISGTTGDDVNEYRLSTAWVVSSAVYSTVFSVSSQDTTPQGLYFRADGTKMYVAGAANDSVFQYTLSTPWSVATASYDSISFSFAGQETTPTGIFFKPNGLSMYIVGQTNDTIYQYTLSTAWNVSTATLLQSFLVSGQELTPSDLSFTGDGSRMFVLGTTGDDINVYNLTTPWDISTSAFVGVFSVSGQDTSPVGLYVKPDGTKMYMVGSANDAVFQYTVPSIDIQLTGPTSVAALDVQQDLIVYGNTQAYKITATAYTGINGGTF